MHVFGPGRTGAAPIRSAWNSAIGWLNTFSRIADCRQRQNIVRREAGVGNKFQAAARHYQDRIHVADSCDGLGIEGGVEVTT